jgi:nitrite reductase/ring-hydroxylating ferredoxin subunit
MSNNKSIMRKALIPFLKFFDLYSLAQLRDRGPLVDYGWFRSFREQKPVDQSGNPLPWLSYPIVSFLEKRVQPHFTVFEFGTGNSTLWWSKKVARVFSCEHDPGWYDTIKKTAPSNVTLMYIESPENDYAKSLENFSEKFEIIIVDGEQRVECAKHALPFLTSDGVIIFDDSDRPEYAEAIRYLNDQGFRKIEFYGMTACVNVGKETSIFYRPENCFHI